MIAPLGIGRQWTQDHSIKGEKTVGVLTNVLCARFLHKESYNRFEGFGIACAVAGASSLCGPKFSDLSSAAAGISLLAVPKVSLFIRCATF